MSNPLPTPQPHGGPSCSGSGPCCHATSSLGPRPWLRLEAPLGVQDPESPPPSAAGAEAGLCFAELEEAPLTVKSDMGAVVRVMQLPDSGLEIRDRMWLKITIANAVIGEWPSPRADSARGGAACPGRG